MKALVLKNYGDPTLLKWEDYETPVPQKDEVRVRVRTTAVNDYDWAMVQGQPLLYRLMFGILRPKIPIPGMELAGVVDEVGPDVQCLKVGDEVFGDISDHGFGSFAEAICISEKALLVKPKELSFVEAAAIPHASLLALQALDGKLKGGQQVLVNGGGGGVGCIAAQLIQLHGATPTGVDKDDKFPSMRDVGFENLIDYRNTDFTRLNQKYDLILDTKTNRNPWAYLRALKPGGTFITVGGFLPKLFYIFILGGLLKLITGKKLEILALKPNKGLEKIIQLILDKKLTCSIDGPYPIEEAGKRIQYFGEGKHIGKVILESKLST